MGVGALFERVLPAGIVAHAAFYNSAVIGLSLLSALVCFVLLTSTALLISCYASKKLAAGMAGMAITILSMVVTGVLSLAVFVVLLATNLRFTR